jgi:hypothetical protein
LIKISKVLDYNFIEEIYLKTAKLKGKTVILGIEIDVKQLQKLDLPKDFICLLEQEIK